MWLGLVPAWGFAASSVPERRGGGAPWRSTGSCVERQPAWYGLGSPILTLFPNLDRTGIPDESAIGDSMAAAAKVMLFEVGTGGLTRVPYFADLDVGELDPAAKTLYVWPAVILKESTRYIVAMRNLTETGGAAIARGGNVGQTRLC